MLIPLKKARNYLCPQSENSFCEGRVCAAWQPIVFTGQTLRMLSSSKQAGIHRFTDELGVCGLLNRNGGFFIKKTIEGNSTDADSDLTQRELIFRIGEFLRDGVAVTESVYTANGQLVPPGDPNAAKEPPKPPRQNTILSEEDLV